MSASIAQRVAIGLVVTCLAGATALAQSGVQAAAQQATALFAAKRYEAALPVLEIVIKHRPTSAGAWYQIAYSSQQVSLLPRARLAIEKTIKLEPAFVDARLLAIELAEDPQLAIAHAEAAIELGTSRPEVAGRALGALITRDLTEESWRLLDQSLATQPRRADLRRLETKLALDTGNVERARAALRILLELEPRNPQLRESHANVLLSLGELEQAEQAFEATLEINPSNLRARQRVIDLLKDQPTQAERLRLHRLYLEYYQRTRRAAEQTHPTPRPGK